jgi:hypothetical protein
VHGYSQLAAKVAAADALPASAAATLDGIGRVARDAAATARGSLALARAKAFSSEAAAAAAGNLFSLDGASFPWPAGSRNSH